jgi:hypothetical protein
VRPRLGTALGVLAAVAALSGVLAIVHHRPYGNGRAGLDRIGLHVGAARALRGAHRASGDLLAAVGAGLGVLAWRRRTVSRPLVGAAFALGAAVVVTGHLLPGAELVAWAARPGSNLSRPTSLDANEGPFPELLGVAIRYDDALVTVAGRRLGRRAVSRIYWTHVVALPALAVALGFVVRRRRQAARSPAAALPGPAGSVK